MVAVGDLTLASAPRQVFLEPVGLRLPEVVEQLGEGHVVRQVVGLEELLRPDVHGRVQAALTLTQALGAIALGEHLAEEALVRVKPQ